MNVESLRGWTPVRVGVNHPSVQWAIVTEGFTDPFFELTADAAMRRPFNAAFARGTPVDVLQALGAETSAAPAGLIFHMSRCGSTLITQMLAQLGTVTALSEPQPIDGILRLRGRLRGGDDAIVQCLRGCMVAFARSMPGRNIVVKLHAWHALVLPLLRRAWPNAPWAFVFREPRGVLQSQVRMTGAELMPGTIDPRYLDFAGKDGTTADAYGARVLAAICDAALTAYSADRALLIDYGTLPEAVISDIVPFFDIAIDQRDRSAMRAVAAIDAKRGTGPFAPWTAPPSEDVDALAARWLDEKYEALTRAAAAR